MEWPLEEIRTPAYVIDLALLEKNLEILDRVEQEAGCTILLALKGFAAWAIFPTIQKYLGGIAASSVHEARLGREEFGALVHTYAPAYSEQDFDAVVRLSDHVVFNSVPQWKRFAKQANAAANTRFGLRINPEHSEVKVALYDPCAPRSRLGITRTQLEEANFEGITGLHFHTLCELGADALERTLTVVEKNFAPWLEKIEWINFGGGHHITREDYDVQQLIDLIKGFRSRHDLEVFLEPGEAIALNTGVLVSSVLDVFDNGGPIAILDTSATAHMPDVLEMPYRPRITGASEPGQAAYTYRLGGLTCLAGDVVGDYAFERPLEIGDKLVFQDMAHYTMVKNTTFNGVQLPSLMLFDSRDGSLKTARSFGYEDYKNRLS